MGFPDRLRRALDVSPVSAAEVARRMNLSSRSRLTEWAKGEGAPRPE